MVAKGAYISQVYHKQHSEQPSFLLSMVFSNENSSDKAQSQP